MDVFQLNSKQMKLLRRSRTSLLFYFKFIFLTIISMQMAFTATFSNIQTEKWVKWEQQTILQKNKYILFRMCKQSTFTLYFDGME